MYHLTYQYVVTYYDAPNKEENVSSLFKRENVVWRDIVTDKISRHDGYALYSVDGEFKFKDSDLGVSIKSKAYTNYTGIRVPMQSNFCKTTGRRPFYWYQAERINHQYIVSYYCDAGTNMTVIHWKDVLTDKVTHHEYAGFYYITNSITAHKSIIPADTFKASNGDFIHGRVTEWLSGDTMHITPETYFAWTFATELPQ
jgi:hypothetical protein